MKKLLLLLLLTTTAVGQVPTRVRSVTSLPATCQPGTGVQPTDEVALVSGGTTTLYVCSATNTWSSVTSSVNAAGLVTSGLIAQYPLTEGAGTTITDISGNGNNGTFCGSAPTWIADTGGLKFVGASNQCVTLPSALNSAKTILLYVGYNQASQANQFNAPILGNGATTSATAGIVFSYNTSQSQNGTIPFKGAARISIWGNNTFITFGKQIWNGVGSLTLTMDTSVNHVYINGKEEQIYLQNTPSASGKQTSGVYQLGGSAANVGLPAFQSWFTGNIYYLAMWNRMLSAAEVSQSVTAINTALSYRALPGTTVQPPVLNVDNPTDELIADGDSITFGYNNAGSPLNNYANAMALNGTWNVDDLALPGFRLGCYTTGGCTLPLLASQDQALLPAYNPSATRNGVIIWAGTNDMLVASRTALQTHGFLRNYCQAVRQIGFKCIVATMISRTTGDTQKNSYNAFIRQYWNTYADALADVAADPNLGADGASASATYFETDNIHPNQFAIYNDEVPVFQRAVNRLYGNRDFSTANIYVAPAAAATATTAGSESTNTVTLTFGTAPCVAGNTVVVAGVTPAGYNGTFTVLTRTATQITYYNSATGLGVVTVQGTAVCAQQQDIDAYTVLNFGAGNFTLESCVGYTGQNIYIKNINAAGSTLVPFGSETIDGAATLSIAAKATVGLQSSLTSAAAGGCTWKQLQNN